jgi:hypothetical protein
MGAAMKSDLAAKLQNTMRGRITPKTGVAGVAGVAATCAKSLKLQSLRPLRLKTDKLTNDEIRGVARLVAVLTEPDPVELEERKGMAMDRVPEAYLDAWAQLQVQKPVAVPDAEWRQAIDDAGRFLDQWGTRAVEFQWTASDLFDVPRSNGTAGLLWFIKGREVRSLGPEHTGLGAHSQIYHRTIQARIIQTSWVSKATRLAASM